ncbi:MAG: cytochrome c oxidase subunit 3 [Crocinitomicaceae bacterium]
MSEELDAVSNNKKLVAKEKIKKNLLWFGIFSIVMLFAGLTSGYIVSKGSSFWVKLNLPSYFVWSCVLVLLSSLLLILATKLIKNNNTKVASMAVGLALIVGMAFGWTQYKGFMTLSNSGSPLTGEIINLQGKYGEYFTLYKNGKEISFDGSEYYYQGSKISEAFLLEMKTFLKPLLTVRDKSPSALNNYGTYSLKLKDKALVYQNNRLEYNDLSLSPSENSKLWHFAEAIIKDRGDFYMIGEYGKDFTLYYKGQEVQYENRKFYKNGQEISPYAYSELGSSSNRASSFILAFVIIHGLHWIAGIIVLLVLTINTGRKQYSASNYTGLKIGNIYWHFLGILWLYLYLFLNFIH